MPSSTHIAEVFCIEKIEPHPNADSLDIIYKEGYTIISQKGRFKQGDLAVHILPESIVDITKPEFSFLDRPIVKAIKLRGVISMGFLIPCPSGFQSGDDLSDYFGIKHYEPTPKFPQGDSTNAPLGCYPKYDIETARKYHEVIDSDELVCVTEKIHGQNSRYVYVDDKMHVGSHNRWKVRSDKCVWWRILSKYPQIQEFCVQHPMWIVYGEQYGSIKHWKYGRSDIDFACFDIRDNVGNWVCVNEWMTLCKSYNIPMVPIIAKNWQYDFAFAENNFTNGPSLIEGSDHGREGCVIKPMVERVSPKIGRVILKLVGSDYLEGKK